jgi:hypothetical protein
LGDPNGNVKLRIFDADTFSPGDEIQVNAAPVDHNQPPALASLSDGGFIIVWADATEARVDCSEPRSRSRRRVFPERRLAGWGARIRTWEWRNQNPTLPVAASCV